MEPNLIHAAETGNLDEAQEALNINPDAIFETDKYNLNALQVAICEYHHEIAYFLLETTNISALHKDAFNRSAMTLSIQFGGEKLTKAVEKRANEEYQILLSPEYNGGATKFSAPRL